VLTLGAAIISCGTNDTNPGELRTLAVPIRYSDFASRVIYFVMPDRYANGDESNDLGGLSGMRDNTGFDPTDTGFYHGGDLKGLIGGCTDPQRGLKRLSDLGFTGIWVTPLVVQRTVQDTSAAYHGYWGIDFTTVDPHLGTQEDVREFVDCAHSLDMRVYLDIVVNHTGDVIMPVGGNTFREEPEPPYETYILPVDVGVKKPEWMNDVSNYHNRGDINWSGCSEACFQQGDFSGLDDFFTEKPAVVDGLAQVFGDWITKFKIDGFRVDTARHVDRKFYERWVPQILKTAREAGVEEFEIFGEVYLVDAIDQSAYVREWGLPNQLDFPLQDVVARYAGGLSGAGGIELRLADDDYARTSNGFAPTPGTFIGNHDIGRSALVIKGQMGVTGDELLRRVNLAHSILYLMRGAPIISYGDEFGLIGTGGDKEARQDLFPTQVSDWQSQERVGSAPIGIGSSFDVMKNPVGEHLRILGALRKEQPVLSVGATQVRLSESGGLVVSRFDFGDRREYLCVFNNTLEPITLSFRTATTNSEFVPLFGDALASTSQNDGSLTLTIPALGASLLRAKAQFAEVKTIPKLEVGADDYSNLWSFTATTSASPQQVTFLIDRGNGWARVAVDDAAEFRGYLSRDSLEPGEVVKVIAVSRFADDSILVSEIKTLTNTP
jgi:glycosidase